MFSRIFVFIVMFPVVFASVAAEAQTVSEAKRVALVIGQNGYKNLTSLSNPSRDAARLAGILKDSGIDVISCDGKKPGCFDLDRGGLLDALEELKARAKGADLAMVFYAGHGMQLREGNVLAPVDISIDCKALTARRGVLLQSVIDAVAGAANQIIILDACRNDPLKQYCQAQRGARQLLSFGRIDMPGARRVMLVSSTQSGQVASDGPAGRHSPFARALFEWLEKSPRVYFDQIFNRVAKTVIERTSAANFTQIPERHVSGVAPEYCLSNEGCQSDPRATALAAELAVMKKQHASDQKCAASARALFKKQSRSATQPTASPPVDRERALKALAVACGGLDDFGDRGARAQEEIAKGNTVAAEKLYAEALAAEEEAATRALAYAAVEAAVRRKKAAGHARKLAALSRRSDIEKAIGFYKRATVLDPTHIQSWIDYGEAALDAGRLSEAQASFSQAAIEAGRQNNLKLRIKATYRLGDVAVRKGSLASARRLYETSLELAKLYVSATHNSKISQRELSVTYTKMGNVLVAQGQATAALSRFRASLAIDERLATSDPGNTRWQRDLYVSYGKVGDVLVAQGIPTAALSRYKASLVIIERLAITDPDNAQLQRDLTVFYNKVGNILFAQGKTNAALSRFKASLVIRERLAMSNLGNTEWQRDLSVSYGKMGDILFAQGKVTAALSRFKASLAIFERLANSDPGNARWQRDISASYWRLAKYEPRTYWPKVVAKLEDMDKKNILNPVDRKWLVRARRELAKLK